MLRIGLLVSDPMSSKYAFDLAAWAQEQEDLQIAALIVCGRPPKPKGLTGLLWALILACERILVRRASFYSDHFVEFDLSPLVPATITADAATLARANLDVLVKLHPLHFNPDLIGTARFGLVELDGAAVARDAAAPTTFGLGGFWPCFLRLRQTPFAVRRLSTREAQPEICASGAFRTERYFSLNQASVLAKSCVYVKDTLKRLAAARPPDAPHLPAPPPQEPPTVDVVLAYGAKLFWREVVALCDRFRGLRQQWSIALGTGSLDDLEPAALTQLPSPAGKFWADPFLWSRDGRLFCFVEELCWRTLRGHIEALELHRDGFTDLGPVVKESFHLSFPFLFEHGGELFMIPESCEVRQVRLYLCKQFPLQWHLHSILMDDVPAADTMVFPHGTHWWLVTTFDRSGAGDYCNELNLYYADSPLSQSWRPHPLNPIMVNSFGGRNAGMMVHDGRLYRFAQRQGFDQYGEGLRIFAVDELTPTAYRETLIREILPTFDRNLRGLHHLSICDGRIAMDQTRMERVNESAPKVHNYLSTSLGDRPSKRAS